MAGSKNTGTCRFVTVSVEKPRIVWLDAAKGAGIILVVIGHALGGLIDSTLGDDFDLGRHAFFAIYTFHMPLFLMLSGMLVAKRISANPVGFQKSLLISIVWPYFLWSVIQFTIIYQLGALVNQPVTSYWGNIISLPWHTVSQFWFLYALFLLHLLALISLRSFGAASFLLVCLALKPLALIVPMPEVLHLAANQAPYYGIGVFLGQAGIAGVVVDRPLWVRGFVVPIAAAGLIILAFNAADGLDPVLTVESAKAAGIANLAWHLEMFPAALAGAFAVIGLASLAGRRVAGSLVYLGQRTMPIFVLHIMAIAGSRIVLIKFAHVSNVWLVLAVTLVAGLIAPLFADLVLRRVKLFRALGLG
jgi:fucose 4-O-acetylase-like acetyltransferase